MRPKRGSGWNVAHKPVDTKGNDAGADKGQAAVFTNALPNQPGPPISARAARVNSRMERSAVTASPYPSLYAGRVLH
jgi:hypothetical protein